MKGKKMFVILVYDVNAKRVGKVMKICRKYLWRVQRSVFEGEITQKQLASLQNELNRQIDSKQDSICIYQFESMKYANKIQIGPVIKRDNIL